MWKCKYCEKTNFDDQTICPYCNAPNPAAANRAPANTGGNTQPIYGGQSQPPQPHQDWNARYNPGAPARSKTGSIVTYIAVGVAAILLVVVLVLIFQKPKSGDLPAAVQQKTEGSLKGTLGDIRGAATEKTPAPTATQEPTQAPTLAPTPEPTLEPTPAPFAVEAAVEVYLDYGETYQCTAADFDLPYDVSDADINWSCDENDAGTTCSTHGRITAGHYQVEPENKFNDALTVTGRTQDGSTLTYTVLTGRGDKYTFNWATSPRTMKGYTSGYVIVCDNMVPQCSGFSIYYKYDLVKGKLDANRWSVWVREDGTTWVHVGDIYLENAVGDVFDIEFDHPITFNEVCVQPETYSDYYSYNSSFSIGYLVFN